MSSRPAPVKTYILPDTLRSGPEVARLNRELREGSIQLDWSNVRSASDAALAALLEGVDLLTHIEALGVETIGEEIVARVLHKLATGSLPEAGAEPKSEPAPEAKTAREADPTPIPRPREPKEESGERELRPATPRELREMLHGYVLKDLLGPAGGPEEEVWDRDTSIRVRDRYLVGALAPRTRHDDPDLPAEDDALPVVGEESAEDGPGEPEIVKRESMLPSSLGLTFTADSAARVIRVTARWGRYDRTHSETLENASGTPAMVWKRVPVEGQRDIPLTEGEIERWSPDPETPEAYVRGTVRRRDGGWIVTLFLVNGQLRPPTRRDTAWLFQAELSVEDPEGKAVFLAREHRDRMSAGSPAHGEQRSLAMLYRNHPEFAVGHGIAVHVERPEGVFDRASRLVTCAVPSYDVPTTISPEPGEIPGLHEMVLDMTALAAMDRETLIANVALLPAAYERWIEEQAQRIDKPSQRLASFKEEANGALARCQTARERIEAGILLLRANDAALDAFRFMNRAMALQRIRSIYAEGVRRGGSPDLAGIDVPANRSWRLFQLAFILLNLRGITDLHHPDRDAGGEATADLLWFPTGGGKTEAYLGLTAYTMSLRRLQGVVAGRDGGHGIAVLMRYTLRLLTLQQFQRASTLLCACEVLRQEAWYDGDMRWGEEPFRVGLWVGGRTTPNTTEASAEAIKSDRGTGHRSSGIGDGGDPAQLKNCPWCGSRIDPGRNIHVESFKTGRGRTLIFCGDPTGTCPFGEANNPDDGLPVLVVDEEIYRLLPALLISTVDKFAQMPWKGETQMLFGRVTGRCSRHGFRSPELEDSDSHPGRAGIPAARTERCLPLRPPDLIIQDELHLISGPLGTLVGLYETAVDELASWTVEGRRVRPKVVASTATIRRAHEQMHGLFLRSVGIFPPHGLDAEDNFFSRQCPPSDEFPGRRYIGLCAQGRRMKLALIRVYVAHLGAAQLLFERYGAAADPWMTLVGYFNAMRDLGGMRRVVDDDVRSRLSRAETRGLGRRVGLVVEELTSRKGATDIPDILDALERRFVPKEKGTERKKGRTFTPRPIDVLLATNMVSVGVDVQRLGLMVVAGQPKTTAEYIQATSRVGRSAAGPGLICTVFNWTRPRDLSHYERFEHFHATFYQQVEALSVTPFAPRAIDRALSALLVSLVRLEGPGLNANVGAGTVDRDHPQVRAALDSIARRAVAVTGREDVGRHVRSEMDRRLEFWLAQAARSEGGRQLGYVPRQDKYTLPLLRQPDTDPWGDFTCLNSLRDVEPEVNLILNDHGMDLPPPLPRGAEPAPLSFAPAAEVEE